MKTKYYIFLLGIVSLFLCACDSKEQFATGQIIATIGCNAKDNNFHKGYIIKTNDTKYLLTFSLDKEYVSMVMYGCYDITPIDLPYNFTYEYISKTDSDYVDYIMPINNAMLLSTVPIEKTKQVRIIPLK